MNKNGWAGVAACMVAGVALLCASTIQTKQADTEDYPNKVQIKSQPIAAAGLLRIGGIILCGVGSAIAQPLLTNKQEQQQSSAIASIERPVSEPVQQEAIAPTRGARTAASKQVQNWIRDLIFNKDGELETMHYHFCGVTKAGKSTLATHVIDQIKGSMSADVRLINPKHVAAKPEWSFEPICKDIDEVLTVLGDEADVIKDRLADEDFDPDTAEKIFIVIDEWDWIFTEYGKDAVKLVRNIFKVGRSVGAHLILCGQSPLSKDTGLSGSDYKNMARIIIKNEAIAFLNNAQFPYKGEIKDRLYKQAEKFIKIKARFALVIPMEGLPFIAEIPQLKAAGSFGKKNNVTPIRKAIASDNEQLEDPWSETA